MTRLQRVASGLFLALLLLAVPRLALEDSARAEVDHLRAQVLAQEESNATQRARNERIREEIEALSSDARAVERVVRQELHAVRPDEHVFFFPSDAASDAAPAPLVP